MIKTWAANITPLYEEPCYQAFYRQAPEFRRKKAEKLRDRQARVQSIGVWTLYTQMRREYGFREAAAFNFSHSGEYVLCSVELDSLKDGVRVGCDIEHGEGMQSENCRAFFLQGGI